MVFMDASGAGLGCVLMQNEKVIAYGSRWLKILRRSMLHKTWSYSSGVCIKVVAALFVR